MGWEGLQYTNPEVTFEADEDIETRPIYQDDYTILFSIAGVAIAGAAYMIIRKRKSSKNDEKEESKEDDILEFLKE